MNLKWIQKDTGLIYSKDDTTLNPPVFTPGSRRSLISLRLRSMQASPMLRRRSTSNFWFSLILLKFRVRPERFFLMVVNDRKMEFQQIRGRGHLFLMPSVAYSSAADCVKQITQCLRQHNMKIGKTNFPKNRRNINYDSFLLFEK